MTTESIKGKAYSFSIIAEIAAMDIPLQFSGYLKPEETWKDSAIQEYYTLNEIDGNSLSGRLLNIKKSADEKYIIYADEGMDVNDMLSLLALRDQLGIELYILNHKETLAELDESRGDRQIARWRENAPQ